MGYTKLQETGLLILEWRRWRSSTDQVDIGTSYASADCVHNKCKINNGLEKELVLIMFRSCVILNDGDKFQGVQYRVCIGAHKKGANKCSCRSVINHNNIIERNTNPYSLSSYKATIITMSDTKQPMLHLFIQSQWTLSGPGYGDSAN